MNKIIQFIKIAIQFFYDLLVLLKASIGFVLLLGLLIIGFGGLWFVGAFVLSLLRSNF